MEHERSIVYQDEISESFDNGAITKHMKHQKIEQKNAAPKKGKRDEIDDDWWDFYTKST